MAQTGTGSAAGDTVVLSAVILGGTCATVWFIGLPPIEKAEISAKVFGIVTIILAQPGVFLAAKTVTQKEIPLRHRLIKGRPSFRFLPAHCQFCYPHGCKGLLPKHREKNAHAAC